MEFRAKSGSEEMGLRLEVESGGNTDSKDGYGGGDGGGRINLGYDYESASPTRVEDNLTPLYTNAATGAFEGVRTLTPSPTRDSDATSPSALPPPPFPSNLSSSIRSSPSLPPSPPSCPSFFDSESLPPPPPSSPPPSPPVHRSGARRRPYGTETDLCINRIDDGQKASHAFDEVPRRYGLKGLSMPPLLSASLPPPSPPPSPPSSPPPPPHGPAYGVEEDDFATGRAFHAYDPRASPTPSSTAGDHYRGHEEWDSISVPSALDGQRGNDRRLRPPDDEPPNLRPRYALATGWDEDADDDDKVTMKRKVALWEGVALIAGGVIGSGIFVSPTGVIRHTESVGLSLVVWFLGGVITLVGALCYAELGAAIPRSGGEYTYLLEAFKGTGPKHFERFPSFMYCWVSLTLLKPASFAIVAKVFAKYLVETFFSVCVPSDLLLILVATSAQIIITLINCISVRYSLRIQLILTVTKVASLIAIIIAGFVTLGKGFNQNLSHGFKGSTASPTSFALALYQCLWAYDGWNYLNYVTEEIKNPSKNILLAILISIPSLTVIYLLTNIAYFTVLSPYEVLHIGAVGVGFADRAMPSLSVVVPLLIAASCFGAANTACLTSGRIYFVAAREGQTARLFSLVTRRFHTPMPALILQCVISVVMNVVGGVEALIHFFSFVAWMFYGLTTLGVIVLRVTRPTLPRPFRVPLAFPVIFFLVCAYLVMAPIVEEPRIEFLYAFLFVVVGALIFIPFGVIRVQRRFKCFDQPLLFFEYLMDLGEPQVAADENTKTKDEPNTENEGVPSTKSFRHTVKSLIVSPSKKIRG